MNADPFQSGCEGRSCRVVSEDGFENWSSKGLNADEQTEGIKLVGAKSRSLGKGRAGTKSLSEKRMGKAATVGVEAGARRLGPGSSFSCLRATAFSSRLMVKVSADMRNKE